MFFGPATAEWGVVKYFSLWNAVTGGEMIYWSEYAGAAEGAPGIATKSGHRLIFWNDQVEVSLSKNQWGDSTIDYVTWSNYLQEKVLNFLFRGQSFSLPTPYLALCNSEPDCEDTGSDLDEPSNAGYGRVALDSWGTPDTTDRLARITSSGTFTFPTPTDSWGTPGWFAITDQSSGGNLLFWQDAFEPAGPIAADDEVTADNVNLLLT